MRVSVYENLKVLDMNPICAVPLCCPAYPSGWRSYLGFVLWLTWCIVLCIVWWVLTMCLCHPNNSHPSQTLHSLVKFISLSNSGQSVTCSQDSSSASRISWQWNPMRHIVLCAWFLSLHTICLRPMYAVYPLLLLLFNRLHGFGF